MLNVLRRKPRRLCGFSLAEMAIVLLIMSILLVSGMGAWQAQIGHQRFSESRQLLARASEALYGYALSHRRLPCPADAALASSHAMAGQENRLAGGTYAYRCVSAYGDLPWQDLGLPELDAWGNRLKYRVTTFPHGDPNNPGSYQSDLAGKNPAASPPCGDQLLGQAPCFVLTTRGSLMVDGARLRNGAAVNAQHLISLSEPVAAVIFSQGANGAGTGADEQENRDGDTHFVQDTPDADFDDLLVWLPTTQLMYRLSSAGVWH